MRAARVGDALLAYLVTIVCILPISWLFDSAAWLGRAAWWGLALLALAMVLRWLRVPRLGVVAGQLAALVALALVNAAPGTLRFGIVPTAATWEQFGRLTEEAVTTIQSYAAPAPATPVLSFFLAMIFLTAVVLVDALAVTRGAPAAAGFVFLMLFLIGAANSANALPWLWFVVAALGWLAMMVRQSYAGVSRWSTTRAVVGGNEFGSTGDTHGFVGMARVVAIVAVLAALIAPAVLRPQPMRFLAGGLARSSEADGKEGTIGFSTIADLDRQLRAKDPGIVFTYRSSAASPDPIKIVTATGYDRGRWEGLRKAPGDAAPALQPVEGPPGRDITLDITDNAVESPHLGSPQPAKKVTITGSGLLVDPRTNDLFVPRQVGGYQVEYVQRTDVPALHTAAAGLARDPQTLDLDPAAAPEVSRALQQVLSGTGTAWEDAVAIQDWLRSKGGFSYTLSPPAPSEGNDLLSSFLSTKRGYCVHFATAMIMMARARGIPARMAIGFLPGTVDARGLWTVRSTDAHAWPELYFEGFGWLRFEPTPGARSGLPPAYADLRTTPTPTPSASTRPRGEPTDRTPVATGPAATDSGTSPWSALVEWFTPGRLLGLAGLLLLCLLALLMPITRHLLARRRRAAPVPEDEWRELVGALTDLGIEAPVGATLRQSESHIAREALLEQGARQALHRVVAVVEDARYARDPAPAPAAFSVDARQVRRAAAGTRSRGRRIRSWLWPSRTVQWWRTRLVGIGDRLGRPLGALWRRVRRARPGRPGRSARRDQSR